MKRQNLIDLLTQENDLVLLPLPESGSTFFQAVSHCLHFTDLQSKKLETSCRNYLHKLKTTDPEGFAKIEEEHDTTAYLKNPRLPKFESLNLEIIAKVFKVKIKLLYINEINLCCDIYNFKGGETIRVFRVHDLHYEPAYKKKRFKNMITVQNTVLSVVDQLFKTNKKSLTEKNLFTNFVWKRWRTGNCKLLSKANKKTTVDDKNVYIKHPDDISQKSGEADIKKTVEAFEKYYNELVNNNPDSDNDPVDVKSDSKSSFDSLNRPPENVMEREFKSYGVNFGPESLHEVGSTNSETEKRRPINQSPFEFNAQIKDDLNLPNHPLIQRKYSANNFKSEQQLFESPWNNGVNNTLNYNEPQSYQNFDRVDMKNTEKPVEKKIEENKRYRGILKFFDEKKNFGFITLFDDPNVDVFVFGSEFQRSKIDIATVKSAKHGNIVQFEFDIVFYWGRHGKSKKAVNIIVI